MYVRWQRRDDWRQKDATHWAAILFENVRVGGKQTQRHVAYLSGIVERDIASLGAQCGFWKESPAISIDWATAFRLTIASGSREFYKKKCDVRRGCNTISGITRACEYSDQTE